MDFLVRVRFSGVASASVAQVVTLVKELNIGLGATDTRIHTTRGSFLSNEWERFLKKKRKSRRNPHWLRNS